LQQPVKHLPIRVDLLLQHLRLNRTLALLQRLDSLLSEGLAQRLFTLCRRLVLVVERTQNPLVRHAQLTLKLRQLLRDLFHLRPLRRKLNQ